MLSNSNSVRHLNNPLNQKVIARNPTYRSTLNFGESSSSNRPFSRKPLNQADHSSFQNIKFDQKQLEISLMQKSLLDTQSVVSGGHSVRQTKFVRTSKMGFLSPKSKNKSREKSFSPDNFYGVQSVILKGQMTRSKKSLNKSIREKQQIVSESSVEQNQIYLQKSISSNNLFTRTNKTRNMILSKFNDKGKKVAQKENKNRLQTSLYTSYMQNQKEDKKKLQKLNKQLKQQNQEMQRSFDRLYEQNENLRQQNSELNLQLTQLTRRLNDITLSKSNSIHEEKTFSRTNQQSVNSSSSTLNKHKSVTNIMNILPSQQSNFTNHNNSCVKCEQKQKSNQKQINYFQNIIKKKQLQISTLKKKESQLGVENSQLSLSLQQTKMKLNELLEHQKISSQTQHKLQQCVNELKQEIAKLKDQLRYLKIQNSVLLKIKNQNLKLKIDITKIQDEKDYFKMKVIQIHKKHGNTQTNYKNSSEKFISTNKNEQNKKSLNNTQKPKRFYLDSTETQETDHSDLNIERRKNKSKSSITLINDKFSKQKQSETDATNFADTLFDLTSEESQNSF